MTFDTRSLGNSFRRGPAISRQHDDPDVLVVNLLDRLRRRRLGGVGHTHESRELAVTAEDMIVCRDVWNVRRAWMLNGSYRVPGA